MPHDWRDSLRLAADLALLGIVVTLLSLPLVTAGAAVAAGSYAIHHLTTEGRWPSFADCRQAFRARLVPGLAAGPAVLVATTLIVLDVAGLRRGAVPGGGPALVAVVTAAALAAGYAGLVAVLAGARESGAREPGAGEPGAREPGAREPGAREPGAREPGAREPGAREPGAREPGGVGREALNLALSRPLAAVVAAAVLAVAALLATLVHPALVPVLAGYVLFALHAVARRFPGPAPEVSRAAGT